MNNAKRRHLTRSNHFTYIKTPLIHRKCVRTSYMKRWVYVVRERDHLLSNPPGLRRVSRIPPGVVYRFVCFWCRVLGCVFPVGGFCLVVKGCAWCFSFWCLLCLVFVLFSFLAAGCLVYVYVSVCLIARRYYLD